MSRDPENLFDPVTGADQRRWQLQAHAALATVLARASVAGLPTVAWMIGTAGQLSGRVRTVGLSRRAARSVFAAWTAFLDLPEQSFPVRDDGSQTLRAIGSLPTRDGSAGRPVGLLADLPPADAGEGR